MWKFSYIVSPQIVSSLEQFPSSIVFRGNYSIYEVKNYHNAETIRKFPHFTLSKKNSFRGNMVCCQVCKSFDNFHEIYDFTSHQISSLPQKFHQPTYLLTIDSFLDLFPFFPFPSRGGNTQMHGQDFSVEIDGQSLNP